MPMLEVLQAAPQPATREQKRAFIQAATTVFQEVLGTPDGRLRIFFTSLALEDSNAAPQADFDEEATT